MTLDSTTSKVQYTQSGTTTAWPVPYKFLDNEDLIVITTVGGVDTTLVLDTDYTVTGAGDDDGGTVTISPAVATGTRVTIYREIDLDQPTELTTAGGWFPKVHEAVFDRLTMQIQQVNEVADRALRLAVTSTIDPEAAIDDLFTARDQAAASAGAAATSESNAATSAAEAQLASSQIGVLTAEGTLPAGQDTITLPFAYDFENEALAVYLEGARQNKASLTFVDAYTVALDTPVAADTDYIASSLTLEGESLLTELRDDAVAAKVGAEAARDEVLLVKQAIPGRNKIINGDFRINQREYVSGTNTTGANQYTLDRWRVVTSGQNVTFSDYLNGLQVAAPAGGIEQVIEDLNIAGGTYVLSWEGTAIGSVNGTVVAKGEPFTLPAKTHATVRLTGGTVARVKLEKGEVVTPFEERFIGDELALCQRYFTKTNVRWRWDGPVGGYFAVSAHVDFATTMRVNPTISVISAANINMTQVDFSVTQDGFASVVGFNNGGTNEIRELKTLYWASAEL